MIYSEIAELLEIGIQGEVAATPDNIKSLLETMDCNRNEDGSLNLFGKLAQGVLGSIAAGLIRQEVRIR